MRVLYEESGINDGQVLFIVGARIGPPFRPFVAVLPAGWASSGVGVPSMTFAR